jgi:hypothetical protein
MALILWRHTVAFNPNNREYCRTHLRIDIADTQADTCGLPQHSNFELEKQMKSICVHTILFLACWCVLAGSSSAQSYYTCPNSPCITATNPTATSWILGQVRTFAFGGEVGQNGKPASPVISELHRLGWLECEGQTLDNGTFTKLYKVIGDSWGTRDSGHTFLIPDLRGLFLRGWEHDGSQVVPDPQNPQTTIPRKPQFPDLDASTRVAPRPDIGAGGKAGNSGDAVGSEQPFALQYHRHRDTGHQHDLKMGYVNVGAGGAFGAWSAQQAPPNDHFPNGGMKSYAEISDPVDSPSSGTVRVGVETRPSNAYVMYFIYVGQNVQNLDPQTGKVKK